MTEHQAIYLISGGYANTYLIEGEGGLVLVDVGSNLAAEKAVDFIAGRLKRRVNELRIITATHFHIDHIGGIPRLLQLAPGSEVNFFYRVGRYLTGEEKLGIPSLSSWLRGLIPAVSHMNLHLRNSHQFFSSKRAGIPLPIFRNFNFLDYQPRCELKEGGKIAYLPGWRLIETRGHTPDSICFYREEGRILISGDTILNMKGTGELNGFYCSKEDIGNSYNKLCELTVENIYPGHGQPILGVKEALKKVKIR